MRTTVQLLDAVKASLNIESDYRLAKELGVSHSRVSNWRCGRVTFNDEIALRVAELLGEPPERILLEVLVERAKRTPVRQALERAAQRCGAAAVALVLGLSVLPGPAPKAGVAPLPVMHYAHWLRVRLRSQIRLIRLRRERPGVYA